jgi:uncharacterized protein YjbI with pentapeptide repeats
VSGDNRQIVRKTSLARQGMDDDPAKAIVPNGFVDLAADRIRRAECYEQRAIRGGSLSGTAVVDVEFENCRFVTVDLSRTNWREVRLRQVRVGKCDLANALWSNASLESLEFDKCRGTGWQLLDAKVSEARFAGGKFNLAAFHGSTFRDCVWKNCDLREANFEGATLADIVFRNCDLRAARMPNCRLKNVDFRGSQLAGLQVDAGQLRGCLFEPRQLLDLADLFGVIVEPLDDTPPEDL